MYFLHSTITLLVVIAHVQCGTLRQYGPDWLIPKPAPHVDSKRITAKSVFIAPSLQAQNVRCATGFREDGSGRCVKLVHVNQAAQLDFLLQRLNAMYGAPVTNHSEKQPLQVAVEIPLEPVDGNDTSIPLKGEEMYSEAILPQGEVSVDLLAGTLNQPDSNEHTTTDENNTTEQNQNSNIQSETNEESEFPDSDNESEDNTTDISIKPNKEWFQVDEEPLVTLTSIDEEDEEDSVDNTTVTPENVSNSEDIPAEGELPDRLFSVNSEDVGIMANVMKNTSNMVKKETLLGDGSVPVTTGFTSNDTFTTETANETSVHNVNIVNNETEPVSHNSNHSANIFQSPFTVNDVKTESTEDESINEVHIKSADVVNATSSKPNDTNTTGLSSSVTSSVQESTSVLSTTEASTTQTSTRLPLTTNLTTRETTTLESTTQEVTTGVPTFTTDEGYGGPTEPSVNTTIAGEHSWEEFGNEEQGANNEEDYDYPIPDVDVEAELPEDYISEVNVDLESDTRYPETVPEGSADPGLVLSVNDSVKINGTVDGNDELFNVETHGGDMEENDVGVNNNVTLNSTKPIIEKTEVGNVVHVSSGNASRFDELGSVTQITETSVEKLPQRPSNVGEQSLVKQGDPDGLKTDSTIHNVEIQPYEFSEIVHSISQQTQHQPVITPQHSVHVVYPQPIIQVMNAEQEPHTYPVDAANQHKPNIGHKENINPNSPHVQFHNLNPIPNPLQHHNVNPLPQMPLIETSPVIPPKYGDYVFPPLPPHSDIPRPNPHPHHRPYQHHNPHPHHNPHHTRYPQNNPNQNGQGGGFVRFPGDPVKTHHAHDAEVNTVRFPQEDTRNNDKYSRWGNWRGDESRGQQNYWAGSQETQYPHGTNRRNYWVDNRPNRRRPQPSVYY